MSAAQRCALVCVTGGIAAYKSCEIVRLLQKRGLRVKVLMSEHATRFVGPTTFRSLTHEKVAVGLFDDPDDPIHHISLAHEADVVVVAPATANVIAKMAHGIADDLLSTTLLATTAPILVAPAMNVDMWHAAATRENMATLRRRGVAVVGPGSGYLACGDVDEGRLADPADIVEAALDLLEPERPLGGSRVLVTAGPTFEPIDPVRFIGNRSSGKMGCAFARAARALGAQVTLVLGPATVTPPPGIEVMPVETAREMRDAALAAFKDADLAICTAAVSDYRPHVAADHKLKKGEEPLETVKLVENPDILAELCARKGTRTVIGFAAETDRLLDHAREKLTRKGCDVIVANDVTRADSGFGTDTNQAWFVTPSGCEELPLLTKDDLARTVLKKVLASCPEVG